MKPFAPALAATLALALLAGCSPSALQAAVQAARDAERQGASPAPGASAVPAASPAATASTGPAGASSAAPTAGGSASADVAAIARAYMAAVDGASEDAERVARLFVAGLVAYDVDKQLGRAMMGYALRSNLATTSATSPTGFEPQVADEIYFRTLDRNTELGAYYLDALASAELPFDQAAAKVVIDKEYKAVDQGLSADGKMWTFYLKVNHPSGVRSRPVRLQRDGEKGWRVSNYSSLMVQP